MYMHAVNSTFYYSLVNFSSTIKLAYINTIASLLVTKTRPILQTYSYYIARITKLCKFFSKHESIITKKFFFVNCYHTLYQPLRNI